jgi:thiamine pyrophosphate-dependent acetolactate synthase large subunit-like protein
MTLRIVSGRTEPMGTVGELIVDSLVANGIDRVFCVPGESYLGLLDALHGRGDIDTVAAGTSQARASWRSPTRG